MTKELARHTFDWLNGENTCDSNAVFLFHVVLLILLRIDKVLTLNSHSISELQNILVKKGIDMFLKSNQGLTKVI